MLNNKKILVTGSDGQLGKTLQKDVRIKMVMIDFLPKEKLDITKIYEIKAAKNINQAFVLIVQHLLMF